MKVAGSGHSFSECALTDGVMVHLDALEPGARRGRRAREGAGGDRACQPQRGARSGAAARRRTSATSTSRRSRERSRPPPTGPASRCANISAQVASLELVTGAGEVLELTPEGDPDGLLAARVSLGALGVISAVTLRTVPAFNLHRVDRVRGPRGRAREPRPRCRARTTTTSSSCSRTRATPARSAATAPTPRRARGAAFRRRSPRCSSATTWPKACSGSPAACTA